MTEKEYLLEDFIAGYLACALWTEEDFFQSEHPDMELDLNIYTSFDPEDLQTIRDMCTLFFDENYALLEQFEEEAQTDMSQAGHSMWLTQNGYGAGFMDFNGKSASALEDKAHALGEVCLFMNDDGKVCLG